MSKLTISDLHFCDISLDASCEVRGGVSASQIDNLIDSLRSAYLPADSSSTVVGPVFTGDNITTSELTGVSISEAGSAA